MNPLRSKPRVRKYAMRSPESHSTVVRTVVIPRVSKYRISASPSAFPAPWPWNPGSIPTIRIHPISWSSPKSQARMSPTRNPTTFPPASATRQAFRSPFERYAVRLPRRVVDFFGPMIALSISTARGMSRSSIGRIAMSATAIPPGSVRTPPTVLIASLMESCHPSGNLYPPQGSSRVVFAGTIEVEFKTGSGAGEVRGIVHPPASGEPRGGLVLAHGRSNDMKNPFVRRIAEAASGAGLLAFRFNFRYVDAKRTASRDLSVEEDDLRGAVRYARQAVPSGPIFVAGKSMGARVCARASADPDVAGMIALRHPPPPMFRPQGRNPPGWPKNLKPRLNVPRGQDPVFRPGPPPGGHPKT